MGAETSRRLIRTHLSVARQETGDGEFESFRMESPPHFTVQESPWKLVKNAPLCSSPGHSESVGVGPVPGV